MFQRVAGLITGLVVMTSVMVDAQRRVPGQRGEATVPITVNLMADRQVYNFSGLAKCTHAPVASIYGLRAERWSVDRSGDGGLNATLSLWRPATGSDLVSLYLTIGQTRYTINTIKVGDKGNVEGSGTIALKPEGKGGTFTVNGTAANGAKISGTVKCEAFTPAFAEGGD